MVHARTFMYALLILGLVALVAACERNVTNIEETTTVEGDTGSDVCFQCHSDKDYSLLWAESSWENSKHASGDNVDRNSSSCAGCHTHEGFVSRITGEDISADNPSVIQCFTCHAPHTNSSFALRVSDPPKLENGFSYDIGAGNLCASCHHARRNVNTYVYDGVELDGHWGPHHGPQGDMLLGSNGYEYDDYEYERAGHRGATKNGCIDCHMEVASMNILGGHSFNMAYLEEGEDEETLNTAACYDCHGSMSDFNYKGVQVEIEELLLHLGEQLETAGLIYDGEPIEDRVVASADSAGALWNFLLVEEDRSHGIHNPEYMIGLLESAIQFMDGTLPAAPAQHADKRGEESAR